MFSEHISSLRTFGFAMYSRIYPWPCLNEQVLGLDICNLDSSPIQTATRWTLIRHCTVQSTPSLQSSGV